MTAKRLPDGRAMLNIGCGTRMHPGWNNLDFSPYTLLAQHPSLAKALRAGGVLSSERAARLAGVAPDVIRHDLRRGIPFASGTFDVVYHSHFLEHVDREAVPSVIGENIRVLKPGGVVRVVVPDLRAIVGRYTDALAALDAGDAAAREQHEGATHELFDQMVRRRSTGSGEQRAPVAAVERVIRGSAARTGENHRWMYDSHSLGWALEAAGFVDVEALEAGTSKVAGWSDFGSTSTRTAASTSPPRSSWRGSSPLRRRPSAGPRRRPDGPLRQRSAMPARTPLRRAVTAARAVHTERAQPIRAERFRGPCSSPQSRSSDRWSRRVSSALRAGGSSPPGSLPPPWAHSCSQGQYRSGWGEPFWLAIGRASCPAVGARAGGDLVAAAAAAIAVIAGVDPLIAFLLLVLAMPAGVVVNDLLVVFQAAKRPWSYHAIRIPLPAVPAVGLGLSVARRRPAVAHGCLRADRRRSGRVGRAGLRCSCASASPGTSLTRSTPRLSGTSSPPSCAWDAARTRRCCSTSSSCGLTSSSS